MNLNHGAPIDTLASWEDPHYGGVSPPPRKKLKRTAGAEGSGESSTTTMQQEVANGTITHRNGNSDKTRNTPAVNGVSELKKASVRLDGPNREMVKLIGQHLSNLGFK